MAHNLDEGPAFGLTQGASFLDANRIPFLTLILFVMGFELFGFDDNLAVLGMGRPTFYSDHNGFIHFVTDDGSHAFFNGHRFPMPPRKDFAQVVVAAPPLIVGLSDGGHV